MAFDLSSLLYDPMFNFGINMMAANAPSRDPRSSSLGWALAQGLGGAQDATRAREEMENRQVYADVQRQYMAKAKKEAERERKRAMTLAGMFGSQPQIIGQTDVPDLPPVPGGGGYLFQNPTRMNLYAPANAEQQRERAMQRIQQLAQEGDYPGAMEMMEALNKGLFPGIPEQPKPPTPAQVPFGWEQLTPDQQKRALNIKHGLEPNATSEENLRMREAGLGLQEQAMRLREAGLGLQRERLNQAGAPAGGGGGKTPLSKTEWNKRISIQKAREAVGRLGVNRATAEQMAKTDPGFGAALKLANEKMPGDDPAWESTMKRRAAKTKAPGSKRTAAEYQAKLDATADPGMRKVIIETARRNGIVLQDRVQAGGIRSRLGF